ncbi:RluA family pseudouridine synthase [Paenibacillus sp. IHBB 10380]|uniref:RluA family pseudouridine synthase n=1 Tax=Paenibacillus sp. IHBB 10380 TaxID=1566358 RepID=UPI0005CFCC68|nr:RluA family pseudouridine synthase [Paenibacillus sp. IHBB 10380]AJS57501.1 pseudouridine synthase [Paenibacillus sp. IHBB 10380]
MSHLANANRRGEWLELIPGKAISSAENADTAVLEWLLHTAEMPEKLLNRLKHEKKIQWKGDRIQIHLFSPQLLGVEPVWQDLGVLYEDDFCLVVHKPAGMSIHPDGRVGLVTLDHVVAAHYQATGQEVTVKHIHRLDQDTTGPVLYAKNEWAQLKLDENMRDKRIDRKYVAFVQGNVKQNLSLIDLAIGKDRHHAQRRRISPTGQSAITHVQLEELFKEASLVRLRLETGRTHQIRVHLSHVGHPLIGDVLYGGNTTLMTRQSLHGERLAFTHPLTKEYIEIEDPWPEDMRKLHNLLRA